MGTLKRKVVNMQNTYKSNNKNSNVAINLRKLLPRADTRNCKVGRMLTTAVKNNYFFTDVKKNVSL